MTQPTVPSRPQVVFLFSDTGGGHRSAAEAIIEAMELEFPGAIRTTMVDFFKQYAPPPYNLAPEIYPPLSRLPDVWGLGFHASDGKRRTRYLYGALWPYVKPSVNRLIRSNAAARVWVSVHPLINSPMLRALGKQHAPFITVVTDMVSTHAAWFDGRADRILVPTPAARERGMRIGMSEDKIQVVGMPVADRFNHPSGSKTEIRERLGWPQDLPILLLVGGGEGMGPIEQVAHMIDRANLPAGLAIITGRNQALKSRLENRSWRIPVKVYGFVKQMPDFMWASDVLMTKAGPGTISEAFIAGLPLILYSRLPGQEEGNVHYVTDHGAGVYSPEADTTVETLKRWLENPRERLRVAAVSRSLARPDASRQIARVLAEFAGVRHKV